MLLFNVLDLLGTIAFATSGALVAMRNKFDPFGVFIIAFVTAVGGGTLRDILVGKVPVWMDHTYYVYAIILTVVFSIIFRKKLKILSRSLFLFDTIGLGIFTIIGTEIGVEANFSSIISIALGTMSAAFGGVIRDILCNQTPVIFHKEIYATAAIIGAAVYIILNKLQVDNSLIYISTIFIVITIRIIAVKFHLSLPTINSED